MPRHADHVRPALATELENGAAQHPLSFRFLAPELERRYQLHAGAESHSGLRVITGASAVLWLAAAFLVPVDMGISRDVATPIAMAMSATSAAFFLVSGRARTLDQQHALATLLTAGNGLVILWLASAGGVLPGYGVSAVLLLFAYGFVSRTRFVYAALRSVVIGIGFVVAAATYDRPGSLLIDAFILGAAIFGTLLALRLLEQSRRRVFVQDLVIAGQSAELAAEKEEAERLLLNILPERISTRLRDGEHTIADKYPAVSVLFADIVGFTPLVARLSPAEMIELLGGLFASFDQLTGERGLEKIKTIGDAYMVAAGLPEPMEDHAERAVDLGLAMIEAASRVASLAGGTGWRAARRRPLGPGGRRGHRPSQVRVRRLGRHGQRREPARVPGCAEPRPRQPCHLAPRPRPVRRRAAGTAPAARPRPDPDLRGHRATRSARGRVGGCGVHPCRPPAAGLRGGNGVGGSLGGEPPTMTRSGLMGYGG